MGAGLNYILDGLLIQQMYTVMCHFNDGGSLFKRWPPLSPLSRFFNFLLFTMATPPGLEPGTHSLGFGSQGIEPCVADLRNPRLLLYSTELRGQFLERTTGIEPVSSASPRQAVNSIRSPVLGKAVIIPLYQVRSTNYL